MIIQHTPSLNPALQPDLRVTATEPAKVVAEPVLAISPVSQALSPDDLKKVVEAINQAMQQSNQTLEFSVDTNSKRTVVKMVDTSTGELIRQFPSETILAISRGIDQFQHGSLLTNQA